MPRKKNPAAWDMPQSDSRKSHEFELERLKAQLYSSKQKIKQLEQKCRDISNSSKPSVDHHEQIMALEQAHKKTLKNMQQHINAKTKELQKLKEETKAQRLVVETSRLRQELKQRELVIDFLKKQAPDRDAINKELVKRTIAFPTRFVRTVDELEMEVVRMARLHQRELKTLKAQLGNRPQDSGDGGDLFREDAIDADGDGIPDDDDQPDKSPGKGDGGDGTTRMEALTLQLHARNETIREVLKQKEDLYKQVHDLKLLEEKLSRTKIKYKMSQDMVAQLQQQLMNATQERDDATDSQQRLEIELEFLKTEAEKNRDEINSLHAKSMENIRVLKARELNLQLALEEQQAQNDSLRRTMQMSKKTLSRKVKDMSQTSASAMKKSSTIAMKLAHLQTELEDKNKLIYKLMQEKQSNRDDSSMASTANLGSKDAVELKTRLSECRKEVADLKEQLQISKHRSRTLESEKQKTSSQITAFKLQTRQLEKQLGKQTQRANELQQQLEDFQNENIELRQKIESMQASNTAFDRTKGDVDIDSHHEPDNAGVRGKPMLAAGNNSGQQLLSEISSTLRANAAVTNR